jgi:hypothetical protein
MIASILVAASTTVVAMAAPALLQRAPNDIPVAVARCQWDASVRAMEPHVQKARGSWPGAKARFIKGLPSGHAMFVTVRLRDERDLREQVFISVDSVVGGAIFARISSDVSLVRGYRTGQAYSVIEDQLVDWTIVRPDGTEEGNVVGIFLESYLPPKCR